VEGEGPTTARQGGKKLAPAPSAVPSRSTSKPPVMKFAFYGHALLFGPTLCSIAPGPIFAPCYQLLVLIYRLILQEERMVKNAHLIS
jgi:hypothetical protein